MAENKWDVEGRYFPDFPPQLGGLDELRRWTYEQLQLVSRALSSPRVGYRDILGQITTRVGATNPTWAQIGAGPFYAYRFSIGNMCWVPFHIPHDLDPTAPISFHVHWLTDGTDTNSTKWEFSYTFAKGFNQEAYNPTGSTVQAEQAASGVAYQHMVTETADFTVSNIEVDGIMYMRMERITNGGTNNADDVFVLLTDLHYKSTSRSTLLKEPPFYESNS